MEVERLGSADQAASEAAFARLQPQIERFLRRYLRSMLPIEAEREDAIAKTLFRIWEKRHDFELRGAGAWWVYVATIAKRCALDIVRKPATEPLDEEITSHDLHTIDQVCARRLHREALYRAADELWLGQEPDLGDKATLRRRLAVQLFLLHRLPWTEVVDSVGLDRRQRGELDAWLVDVGVALGAAFGELYWSNERLACRVLEELKDLAPLEEKVVVWRLRNGLLTEKILQLAPMLTKDELDRLFERCCARFPFDASAAEIAHVYRKQPRIREAFAKPDLWKRLVFQYHVEGDLPHRQILERTESPAAMLGYRLNANILNVWIGNNRLVDQLARYIAGRPS